MNPRAPRTRRRSYRTAAIVLAGVAIAGAAWAWTHRAPAEDASAWRTAVVDEGDIRVAISATGTLSALSTVDVGSQISGLVSEVLVDFNDAVARGQVLARIDPSTYEAQIAQGAAGIGSARASLASAEAALRNAEADHARKASLVAQQLVARGDADQARAARDQARAQVALARAQIAQQQAATQGNRLNLDRTVIRSPVDGVVLTRTIEPGQTVAASLQAPVLFQIAEDLAQMQIVLAIDESDIGQVKPGQAAAFTVDAYPDRRFRGTVQQVRLSATNASNVITYPVVVLVDNADLTLLPGMTANAEISVSQRDGVLRVPNAALRYKPEDAGDAGGAQAARGAGMVDALVEAARGLDLDAAQQAAFDEAAATLRERAASRQAPAAAQGGSALFGGRGGGGGTGGGGGGSPTDQGAMRQRMLQRFQQQFGAFRATLDPARQARWDAALAAMATARRAPLYKLVDGQPQRVMVQVGVSDGSNTEVSGDIRAGDRIIVGASRTAEK